MISSFSTQTTYQVTDLARNHREVVDTARHGGALIRDKDGVALILAPASEVAQDHELAQLAGDFLRLYTTMELPPTQRTVPGYGTFAWLGVFDEEYQRQFISELSGPLLVALSGGPLNPVVSLIEDWKATAVTYADDDLRVELIRPLSRPLETIEL